MLNCATVRRSYVRVSIVAAPFARSGEKEHGLDNALSLSLF